MQNKIRLYQEEERLFVLENLILIKRRKSSKFSKGEFEIANFLSKNGITFFCEFYFKELKILNKRKLLFFDFYIPDYRLCIEFDGQQHYTGMFYGKQLKNQSKNDFLKSAFCKKNSLNLLRIKYTDIKNIEDIICRKFDHICPIII